MFHKDTAKQKMISYGILNFVNEKDLEDAFSHIHVYDNQKQFLKAFGDIDYDGKLEGFNRSDGSHISPLASDHSIIHEVLHGLSSRFDENGRRTQNGLMGKGEEFFSNQVNEGVTDYLASKISKEKPQHYLNGNRLFSKIDGVMERYYDKKDILLELYIHNNDKELKSFIDITSGKGSANDIYEKLCYLDNEKIDILAGTINKNGEKQIRKRNRKERWKQKWNTFISKCKKTDTLMLEESQVTANKSNEDFTLQLNENVNKAEDIISNSDIIVMENPHKSKQEPEDLSV